MSEPTVQVSAASWVMLGAGGHARSVADVIARAGGVIVAVTGAPRAAAWGLPVLADDEAALSYAREAGHRVAFGVGSGAVRTTFVELVLAFDVIAEPVFAGTSTVAPDAVVGLGTVVMEHAHVGPAARVGRGAIINTAAVVEHDCVVGDAAHIAPGAVLLGSVRVDAGAMVGSGACILPGRTIGADAVVGAGAVVREDVPAGRTVVGVPAVEQKATQHP